MESKYAQPRPPVPAPIRREAEIESGHKCSVAHCDEHTYVDLHHIDGNRENNRIENVILLCAKHHRMAERGEIDRKSLYEYKRLNRERAGLSPRGQLSDDVRAIYLKNLLNWLQQEIEVREHSPINVSAPTVHVVPRLVLRGILLDQAQFDLLIVNEKKVLLLGNGGSGKTLALLSWLRDKCIQAIEQLCYELPIFVSLKDLTARTDLKTLIRASLGRNGISLTSELIDRFLVDGHFLVVFDGLNEIGQSALDQGTFNEVFTFADVYSSNSFIISSRYITALRNTALPTIEVIGWDKSRIMEYLSNRLGSDLGVRTFNSLGRDFDYEWLSESSIAGLCSNPLILSMIATTVEKTGKPLILDPHDKHEAIWDPAKGNRRDLADQVSDIVSQFTDLMISRVYEFYPTQIHATTLREILEEFAYRMIEQGEIVAMDYGTALAVISALVRSRSYQIPLPIAMDAYALMPLLVATGLLRRTEDRIEWVHQILHEHLSIAFSSSRLRQVIEIAKLAWCPHCGYLLTDFVERDKRLFGLCSDSQTEYEIIVPRIPQGKTFKSRIKFVDQTGLPHKDEKTAVPHSFFDEGYMRLLPLGGLLFIQILRFALDDSHHQPISRFELERRTRLPSTLFDLETWALVEAGLLRLKHKNNLTTAYTMLPPINPSGRLLEFHLVTLRYMTPDELEEDPEERFGLTSVENEERREDRIRRNLPILHTYPFLEGEIDKLFRIAQEYGGQVRRVWGPYEEVIAEFPGEAWDFTLFNSDKQDDSVI